MSSPNPPRFTAATGEAYDRFMGRYSRELAPLFADHAGVAWPMLALDVGCGPGALTRELVQRLGPSGVSGCDPTPAYIEACQARNPGVTVLPGTAEALPYPDDLFDVTLAQLAIHLFSDPLMAATEMRRVTKSGGTIAGSVWDLHSGVELFTLFGDRVQGSVAFGGAGEIAALFTSAGLTDIDERLLRVSTVYDDFDEFWSTIEHSVGPMADYVRSLPHADLVALREELFNQLGRPEASFSLSAMARSVTARVP